MDTRVALVTGASRGIGRAIAVGMAKAGFDIVLNDVERQHDDLRAVASQVEGAGRRAVTAYADVSRKDEVISMVAYGVEAMGRLDCLVNNAGILTSNRIEALTEEEFDRVFAVNMKGVFLVSQAVLPHMRARRYGRIVNIASIGGKLGTPGQAHYSATKAAVMGFTRVLAEEAGPDGITANCVCPGLVMTEMGKVNLKDQASIDRWTSKIAVRRVSEPEDIVGPVVFFGSDASAYVTGQTLNVDGGMVYS